MRVKMKSLLREESGGCDRPYERCLRFGAGALSDAELLAVIIRTGTKGMTAVELAEKILRLSKAESGLGGLSRLSVPELVALPGIGEVKAIQLLCIGELSKRIAVSGARKLLRAKNPETIASYYMEQLRCDDQENIICMMLDTKLHFIGEERITRGTVDASLLSTRDLFLAALRCRAVNIILIHNHPSGDPTPSRQDIVLTEKVSKAGELIDIKLIDHIVIGDRSYVSFAESGLI